MVKKLYKLIVPIAIIINVGILLYFLYTLTSKGSFQVSEGLYAMASLMSLGLGVFLILVFIAIVLYGYSCLFFGYVLLIKTKSKITFLPCIYAIPAIILSLNVLYIFDYYYLFGFSLALNIIAIMFFILTYFKVKKEV